MFIKFKDEWVDTATKTNIENALNELQKTKPEEPKDGLQFEGAMEVLSDNIINLYLNGYSVNQITMAIHQKLPYVLERNIQDKVERILNKAGLCRRNSDVNNSDFPLFSDNV